MLGQFSYHGICKEINLKKKLDLLSPLDVDLNFQQLKTSAIFPDLFFHRLSEGEGICSVTRIFSVSFFIILPYFIVRFSYKPVIMLFLASCVTLLRILQYLT
jgi:hypothetical protein